MMIAILTLIFVRWHTIYHPYTYMDMANKVPAYRAKRWYTLCRSHY